MTTFTKGDIPALDAHIAKLQSQNKFTKTDIPALDAHMDKLQKQQPQQSPTSHSLPDGSLNPELLATLDYPKEPTLSDSLGEGFRHGVAKIGLGVGQRVAQAAEVLGIDTDDLQKSLNLMYRISDKQGKATREAAPFVTGAGEIAGEVAAMPLPATKIPGIIGTGAAIGGAQYGERGTLGEFAGNTTLGGLGSLGGHYGGEAIVKVVKSSVQKLFGKKVPDNLFNPDGSLKPGAKEYFDENGISEEVLSENIEAEIQALPEGSDPVQALRKAEARDLGVTELTKGDISQAYDDQYPEFVLQRQSGTPEAETLRRVKALQNEQLIKAGEDIAQGMGDPDKLNVGTAIQEGLRGTRDQRREAIRDLYRIAEEQAGVSIPVEQKGIAEAFAEQDFLFGLDPDVGGQLKAVQKQLEAFSVLDPDVLTDASRIQSLNIGTAEQLRKNINALINETSPKSARALKPIINAIDEAVDTLTITDDMGEAAAKAFKEARAARRQFALDFEAKDIIQDIVSTKPGTQTDKIHASVIFDKIMGTRSRLEATQAVKKALLKGGHNDTWNDFKATAAAELIGKGLTTGKTATGQMRFSGANFNKALKKIGNPTLETIFGPQELARLRQLGRVSRDLTILQDGVFTPSGAHAENALFKLSRMLLFRSTPSVRIALEEGGEVMKRSTQRNSLRQVLNPSVDVAKQLGGYSNAAINALRLMAISGQSQLRDNEDEK